MQSHTNTAEGLAAVVGRTEAGAKGVRTKPEVAGGDLILFPGDDEDVVHHLEGVLRRHAIPYRHCRSLGAVERAIAEGSLILVMDCVSDGRDDVLQAVSSLLSRHPQLRLIGLVPHGYNPSGYFQELLRFGWLHDFHTMPVDEQRFVHCLGHLNGLLSLERRYADFRLSDKTGWGKMVGLSRRMQEIYETIWRVAPVNTPVLVTGESGTGKELVARSIHEASKRRHRKFVTVNCAALPPNLIASELFGHEAGAYTGAAGRKRGLVEEAEQGTLFLDEIGDMPLDLQPHFLRFLQDGSFKRLGGNAVIKLDLRVIAATNVDLRQAIKQGHFREDLFYRINVLNIHIPPLRERPSDVELLALHYLRKFCDEYNRPRLRLSDRTITAMIHYTWPGNIRELASAIRRAVIMSRGVIIRPEDLGLGLVETPPSPASLRDAREQFDRQYIRSIITRNRGNVQKTARELGISRVALYRLLKRHGIEKVRQGESYGA